MSDVFRYIKAFHTSLGADVTRHEENAVDTSIVHKIRLKMMVKKLLGKKKRDTFGDIVETLIYTFDMKTNQNGELIVSPRKDPSIDYSSPSHQEYRQQSDKHPLKK